jgi:hypothetical protein
VQQTAVVMMQRMTRLHSSSSAGQVLVLELVLASQPASGASASCGSTWRAKVGSNSSLVGAHYA